MPVRDCISFAENVFAVDMDHLNKHLSHRRIVSVATFQRALLCFFLKIRVYWASWLAYLNIPSVLCVSMMFFIVSFIFCPLIIVWTCLGIVLIHTRAGPVRSISTLDISIPDASALNSLQVWQFRVSGDDADLNLWIHLLQEFV